MAVDALITELPMMDMDASQGQIMLMHMTNASTSKFGWSSS
jgi:hypothetical protein